MEQNHYTQNQYLFSMCSAIIGKDSTPKHSYIDKNGTEVFMTDFAKYRNSFINVGKPKLTLIDDVGKLMPWTRKDIVNTIAVNGYAIAYIRKDDSIFKGRSLGSNTLGTHIVMLDFDNTCSIDEVMQHSWWDKSYFAYATPSFGAMQNALAEDKIATLPENHVLEINKVVGQPKRNFRLVFRTHRMLTPDEIKPLNKGLHSLFPLADPATSDLGRMFFGCKDAPFVEMPFDEYVLTENDIKQLISLGQVHTPIGRVSSNNETHAISNLNMQSMFKLSDGTFVLAEDIWNQPIKTKYACFAINRHESNPSAFIMRNENYVFYFDSGTCEKAFIYPEQDNKLQLIKSVVEVDQDDVPIREVDPIPGRKFEKKSTWDQRMAKVADFMKRAVKSKNSIIVTPEGYGKSTQIINWCRGNNKKVVFCCSSWKQAESKLIEFTESAITDSEIPQMAYSTGQMFKNMFGFEAIFTEGDEAFFEPQLDSKATVSMMVEKNIGSKAECAEALEEIKITAKQTRKLSSNLIVTTFATGNILYDTFNKPLEKAGYVWIVDDPNSSDLLTHKAIFDKDDNSKLNVYDQRERTDIVFASSEWCSDPVIWTTTETLVKELIKHHHNSAYICEVSEAIATHNRLMICPTNMTKKILRQPLIDVMKYCLDQTRTSATTFANGVDADFNLVSSKGMNTFRGQHTIIVASHPHPNQVADILATLNLGVSEQHLISTTMLCDSVDQAIGRNNGYRYEDGASTLVITHPRLRVAIQNNSRYELKELHMMHSKGLFKNIPFTFEAGVEIFDHWTSIKAHLETWDDHVIVVGEHIYSLLTLQKFKFAQDEYDLIKKRIKSPKVTGMFWRKLTEQIDDVSVDVNAFEDDDSGFWTAEDKAINHARRNFVGVVDELASDWLRKAEEISAAKKYGRNSKGGSSRTGKKTYISPDGNERKMFNIGDQPTGWTLKSNR